MYYLRIRCDTLRYTMVKTLKEWENFADICKENLFCFRRDRDSFLKLLSATCYYSRVREKSVTHWLLEFRQPLNIYNTYVNAKIIIKIFYHHIKIFLYTYLPTNLLIISIDMLCYDEHICKNIYGIYNSKIYL